MLKTADGAQHKLEFAVARADFAAKTGAPNTPLDGDNTTGWSIAGQTDART
jgi:hypothetical protein